MSTRLILLSVTLSIQPIHAMKRSYNQAVIHWNKKSNYQTNKIIKQKTTSPQHTLYIPDIENIFLKHISTYPLAKKPTEATRTIQAFLFTNKHFYSAINNPTYSDNLIDMLSKKLHCSHETIAKLLATKSSQARLNLQYKLQDLCRGIHPFTWEEIISNPLEDLYKNTLASLISQNVNLEFTYNDNQVQKTPLMITFDQELSMFNILKDKVNINNCNNHSISLLNLATKSPIQIPWLNRILTHSELNINQQNKRGETALLACLLSRPKTQITTIFITAIEKILKAGADPEIANNKGMTPLIRAKQLKNERIINLIAEAIESRQQLK